MSGTTASIADISEPGDSGEHERLGRFSLLRVIGRGASATVYEAMDTRMERAVALKVLSFDPLLTPEQRQRQIERFEREARAVARLSHPNIVSVYDVGEADGKHFLVMELLSGVTLRERIEQGGPIALGEATSIVEQIASALDCTHTEGIVHRDIKPSNVLLLPDGRVKMLDFGIARHGEDATVTHAGMLIGSPAYMSPEQGRGESASLSSDIWALGALLYEMLTGQSPFGASNVAAVLYKAAYDAPAPLPEDAAPAQKIIDHALAKLPEERYASAGALANALRAAVDYSPPASTQFLEKRSLQSAASGAFIPSSTVSTIAPMHETVSASTAEGTAEVRIPARLRLADIGVLIAWGAVVIAALSIVLVRLRQSSLAAATTATAKSMVSPTAASPSPVRAPEPVVSRSGAKPVSVTAPVRIVEKKTVIRSPEKKAAVAQVPMPSVLPAPAISAPAAPKVIIPSKTLKAPSRPAAAAASPGKASAAPAWDDRIDRLGDPEPEPEQTPTPPPTKKHADDPSEGSSEKQQFKPSVLLGRWQGNIGKRPATLNVQRNDEDSFQGSMTVKTEHGPQQFSISGTFSPVTGRISFWSSDTARDTDKPLIDIGQESGRLISRKTMGGLGVDSKRIVFTWSFSR